MVQGVGFSLLDYWDMSGEGEICTSGMGFHCNWNGTNILVGRFAHADGVGIN